MAVTFDQAPSKPALKYAASTNGGADWGSLQYLNDGHLPNMDADTSGNVHLIYEWYPANYTGYRKWNGSTWTAAQQVSPSSNWQGWADVAVDTGGTVHVVYDDESARVRYVNSAVDNIPPGQVSGLTSPAGHWTVHLNWTNPYDPDFAGTMIRYKTTAYPSGPTDGTLLCSRTTVPGASDGFEHAGAVNGTTYYYTAFAYDAVPNCSAGAQASAMPYVPPDFDRDGDVDQKDFGHLQECYSGVFVPQETPACLGSLLDNDIDVDFEDLAVLLGCFSGSGVTANPNCAG
jgi:hypothetical protein